MSEAGRPRAVSYRSWLLWGLCLLSASVPLVFSPVFSEYDVPKLVLFQTLTVALGALLLVSMVLDGEVFAIDTPLNYTLLGFLAANFVSLFQAYNTFQGLYTLSQYVCYFGIVLLVIHAVKGRGDLHRMGASMTAAGGSVAVIGLLQHNAVTKFYHAWGIPVSTIGNTNFVAEYYDIVFPMALAMLLVSRRWWTRAVALAACFAIACHLVVLGSRGGWLGVAVTAVVMGGATGIRYLRVGRRVLDLAVTSVVMVCLAWPVTMEALSAVPVGQGRTVSDLVTDYGSWMTRRTGDALELRDNSSRQRVLLWEDTLSLVFARPLVGVGVGNYEFNIPRFMSRQSLEVKQSMEGTGPELAAFRAHNEYLEIWAETGILGFLVFMFLLGQVGLEAVRGVRRYIRGEETVLAPGLAAAFCASLAHSFFSTNLQDASSAVQFWIVAGMLWHVKLSREGERRLGLLSTGTGPFAFGLMATAVLATAVTVYFCAGLLRGDAHYHEGLRAFKTGDYAAATGELEEALRHGPPKPYAAYELLGKARYNLGDYGGAAEALERSIRSHRNQPGVYYTYGQALEHLGRTAEALPALARAVELYPIKAQYRLGYGLGLGRSGDPAAGLKEIEQAAELTPDDPAVHLHLGGLRRQAGNLAGAEAALERGLSLRPDDPELLNSLGVLRVVQGRPEEAEELFRRLIAADPHRSDSRLNLAIALYSLGEVDEALEACHELLIRSPSFARAHEFVGRIYQERGDSARAEEHMRKAGGT